MILSSDYHNITEGIATNDVLPPESNTPIQTTGLCAQKLWHVEKNYKV